MGLPGPSVGSGGPQVTNLRASLFGTAKVYATVPDRRLAIAYYRAALVVRRDCEVLPDECRAHSLAVLRAAEPQAEGK